MKLYTKYMTRNDCYTAGRKITPKGIMVHSTATPGVMAADWFSRWNKSYKAGETNRQVCVHAFVDDKEVWQYLPWNHRGWHCGGSGNDTHIGFEICEDGLDDASYFAAVYREAAELCAYLCKEYGLTERDVICHSEGYKLGIASNHSDVMHWFPRFGKSMDAFRAEVRKLIDAAGSPKTYIVKKGDSLWGIARKELGSGARYPEVMSLNGLSSTTIYPGQVLKIPK